ncbi:MAG: Gfo/Idh/MocA family oxidoreductase [Gammaproteobacteria bacterium]|nr:Gfo/Idh/MocA family oxidoreductase [Gammaproteobacteria bacterium]
MQSPHRISIIGLGVMGQRMLHNMHRYPGFEVVAAFDPDPAARRHTQSAFPAVTVVADAESAIQRDDVGAVYIACPPLWHETHARSAADAGKAVWCEKPLGVNVQDSTRLVEHVTRAGVVNIVNFSLASASATFEIEQQLASGALGEIRGVDIRVHFSQWPRAWQMAAAGWLSYREEGGFTREVLSHWIYLSRRLFGPLALTGARTRYPDDNLAETHTVALLDADDVPIGIAGSVGGQGPDLVEYTIWGSKRSYRILDWNQLWVCDEGQHDDSPNPAWRAALPEIADPRETGYANQLDNAARALAGEAHSMPDFATALQVQTLVEDILES